MTVSQSVPTSGKNEEKSTDISKCDDYETTRRSIIAAGFALPVASFLDGFSIFGSGIEVVNGDIELTDDLGTLSLGSGLVGSTDEEGVVEVNAEDTDSAESERVSASNSGTVTNGDAAVLEYRELSDEETLTVTDAGLLLSDGTAAPDGLDLVIATTPNDGTFEKKKILIDGDGAVKNSLGDSVSYTNNTGSRQTVSILIDNGLFNSGTGSNQDSAASITREVF